MVKISSGLESKYSITCNPYKSDMVANYVGILMCYYEGREEDKPLKSIAKDSKTIQMNMDFLNALGSSMILGSTKNFSDNSAKNKRTGKDNPKLPKNHNLEKYSPDYNSGDSTLNSEDLRRNSNFDESIGRIELDVFFGNDELFLQGWSQSIPGGLLRGDGQKSRE
eukprot:UN33725